MAVITAGMEELNTIRTMTGTQKLATLEAALRDIAAGADGVANIGGATAYFELGASW
jgi:hypothetical protein